MGLSHVSVDSPKVEPSIPCHSIAYAPSSHAYKICLPLSASELTMCRVYHNTDASDVRMQTVSGSKFAVKVDQNASLREYRDADRAIVYLNSSQL